MTGEGLNLFNFGVACCFNQCKYNFPFFRIKFPSLSINVPFPSINSQLCFTYPCAPWTPLWVPCRRVCWEMAKHELYVVVFLQSITLRIQSWKVIPHILSCITSESHAPSHLLSQALRAISRTMVYLSLLPVSRHSTVSQLFSSELSGGLSHANWSTNTTPRRPPPHPRLPGPPGKAC